ncbi:defense/immunity protein [Lithospermum erythrorhizon]|uniref:Defense/immunity protein n=1 Tax=Lithospermum erythrorhizon TaxID=34254 RepID=A0AAV3PRS7_LITER
MNIMEMPETPRKFDNEEGWTDKFHNGKTTFEYSGWIYHLGVNKFGHDYCHLRFLFIRGRYLEMYKRDPVEYPGIKPIRKGVIGHTLMVEERGRRKVNNGEIYVLRFYNRLDETKKGEIACATAGEARNWMEAFDQAKHVGDSELARSRSTRRKLSMDLEIDLEMHHRPRVRRYASGLKKLIRIGQGPETLTHQNSNLDDMTSMYLEGDGSDVVEAHEWKCVRTINGVRIFEDVASSKSGKGILVKAVGVVNASTDTVFEVILSLDRHKRYEWDTLTGDLELLDSLDGHYDVLYGKFDQRYSTWWHKKKRDFVFSRQWFHGQDGTYTILQFPAVHKKCPTKYGYHRTKINPSTWEIQDLNASSSDATSCLVTQTLEVYSKRWIPWRNNQNSNFEKSVPYALLSQVAGLKEYIGANPALTVESPTVVQSNLFDVTESNNMFEDEEVDEFYDAIAAESSSEDEDSDVEAEAANIAGLTIKRTPEGDVKKEFDPNRTSLSLDPNHFHGSMTKGNDEADTNCWMSPSGSEFMVRGKTYLTDNTKICGGDPRLKLIAVDWFKVDSRVSQLALHPQCLVQSEAGKGLPFILVINLQVPAKPNYSLVMYYASESPIDKDSLLGRFIDGTDSFRDSRFKLIPRIVEGYWMVKRAVGSKSCLLAKAVTCRYLRQDNFLEIDVDIGSSSVARGVIGLVLGYVTSIVVDLAIVIEAKEKEELPEYILGTVRLTRVRVESAVPLNV